MDLQPFDLYFKVVIAICVVMTFASLARFKSKGLRSVAMAIAFSSMAVEVQGLRSGAQDAYLATFGVIIFASLVADAFLRSTERRDSEERSR